MKLIPTLAGVGLIAALGSSSYLYFEVWSLHGRYEALEREIYTWTTPRLPRFQPGLPSPTRPSRIDDLEQQILAVEAETNGLSTVDADELERRVDAVEFSVDRLVDEAEGITAVLSDLEGSVGQLESTVSDIEYRLDDAEFTIRRFRQLID
jgi:hypothetical protein